MGWAHEFKPYSDDHTTATKRCRKCGATDAIGDPRGNVDCPKYARSLITLPKNKSAQAPTLNGTTDSLMVRAQYAVRALQTIAHGNPSTWSDKALRGGEARKVAIQALADLEEPLRPSCPHCSGLGYIPTAPDPCAPCGGLGTIDPKKLDWSKT